jgi:MFS family permease
MSIEGSPARVTLMHFDRLPVALGSLLCAALTFFWIHAPVLPDDGSSAAFVTEFVRTTTRQRLIVFPLGVATSIATLVVLLRHGGLLSRRGGLQIAATLVLFASGLISMLATEPTAKEIVATLAAGSAGTLGAALSRLGFYYELHLGLAFTALACLVVAERQPMATASESTSGLAPGHRRLLFLLGTATLFQGYDTFIVSMALPYIGRDLGASEGQLGLALSAIRVGALVSVLLGRAADRGGRRRLLLVTVLAYTIATAATGLSRGITQFVVCQLVAEVFLVTEWSLAQVVIAEEFPASVRSLGQGLLGTFGALGAGLAALLFPIFQETAIGWRGLYFVGIAPLLLVAYLRRSLPETARWQEARRRGETQHGQLADLFGEAHRLDFLVLVGLSFALGASAAPAFGFASYRATNTFGWTPSEVSAMVLLGGGLGMAGWFASGLAAERLGRRRVGMLAFAAMGGASCLYYTSRWLAPAFAALVFMEASGTVALNALGTELFPTRLRSTAKSWITNAAVVGAVAGMASVGALSDALGGADAVMRLLAVLPIACAASLLVLPETRGLELEEISARRYLSGAGS